ncbi:DUF2817 domain-containing protein [bacterium]|nr:DUF2817 domain-containing protein [bacterium]
MNILKVQKTILRNEIELIGKPSDHNKLIIGVFHGDEPQGKYLIDEYLKKINKTQEGLLFIPCLNPDGMKNGTRTNSNKVDLNRNFPTKNWGRDTSLAGSNPTDYYCGKSAGSEIETQFLVDILEQYKPETILALHTPYKIVNYDGPAKSLAQKISSIINYPVEESIGYPTPGSFGTYCGIERNIPTITLEMDETCPIEELVPPIFTIFDLINCN